MKDCSKKVRTIIFQEEQNCNEYVINKVEVKPVSEQSIPQLDDVINVLKVTRKQNKQPPTEHKNNNYNYYNYHNNYYRGGGVV